MKAKLAMGVTFDFINTAPTSARFTTYLFSPIFFCCCLLTSVPRQREAPRSIRNKNWSAAQ